MRTSARSWALDPSGSRSMAGSADVAPLPVTIGIRRSSGKTHFDSASVSSSGCVTQDSLPESMVQTDEPCKDSTGLLPVVRCRVFRQGWPPDIYLSDFHDFTPQIDRRLQGGGQSFV